MLPSAIRLRQYAPADRVWVEDIERASLRELTSLSQICRYYEIIPEGFVVAEAGERVLGYLVANLHIARDGAIEGHILAIAVHPDYRRNGIGAQLLSRIWKVLQAKGASRIRLEVKVGNTAARRFYQRLGFQETQLVRRYYRMRGYTEDAVFMIKQLSSSGLGSRSEWSP